MRNTYILAYDIADNKRRNKAFKLCKGHGEALQYSVFRCNLSPMELVALKTAMWEVINLAHDRVTLLDLGPQQGRATLAIETWGIPLEDSPPPEPAFIV